MIKILVTSVGSLVGQNILDALEGRREYVTVVGLNSIAESQRVYRCDRAYLVPETAHAEFAAAFESIVQEEDPDLILAGRDRDVVFLAHYRKNHPDRRALVPVGEPFLAELMLDKYHAHRFAQENGLPFADTLLYRDSSDAGRLEAFIAVHGFPLLVKPREGFASINVFIVTGQRQVEALLRDGGEVLFQEYLSPVDGLDRFREQLTKGIPLFFGIPIHDHMVSQAVISKNGTLLDYISTKQTLVMGRTEYARVHNDPNLDRMIELYARTLAERGWWGYLNIQSRLDRNNTWKVFELNPRLSGATSTRLHLGLDELGLLLAAERPEWRFPVEDDRSRKQNHIFKYLSDHCVAEADMEHFRANGIWKKG